MGNLDEGDTVRPHTLGLIWGGGILLAVLLYLTGPDRFLAAVFDMLLHVEAAFHNLVLALGIQAYNFVRAAAIALFAVFLVLGLLAAHRGLRAWSALIVVSAVFVVLVWSPDDADPVSIGHWLAALLLAIAAAGGMTRRLIAPPGVRSPPPAWPNYKRGPD